MEVHLEETEKAEVSGRWRRSVASFLARKPLPVRYWMALLLAVCIVPVWLGAAWILERAAMAKRELIQEHLLDSSRQLSQALDGRIASMRLALNVLASSAALDSSDFATFHRQARRVAQQFPHGDIILADRDGAQLVNSYSDFGVFLPKQSIPEISREVFESGQSRLRPHFKEATSGRSLIGVDVPVIRNGTVIFDLGLDVSCQYLSLQFGAGHLAAWLGGRLYRQHRYHHRSQH